MHYEWRMLMRVNFYRNLKANVVTCVPGYNSKFEVTPRDSNFGSPNPFDPPKN